MRVKRARERERDIRKRGKRLRRKERERIGEIDRLIITLYNNRR